MTPAPPAAVATVKRICRLTGKHYETPRLRDVLAALATK